MPVVEISELTKRFGRVQALDHLDLRLEQGEVLGFLGPNGAGKSTTIRILLGLLRADAGRVRVLDGDPWRDAVSLHPRLAHVPGDVTLWPNLTGGEAIDVLAGLRGPVDRGRRDELVERFDLDPTKKCGTYSKGNRQKVALVAALSGEAELLVLDEPTSGLDPLMEAVFDECVLEAKQRGASVLLSSHVLAQVEKLCDRLTIIRAGRVVDSGSLAELRHLTRTRISATLAREPRLSGVHHLQATPTEAGWQVECDLDGDQLDAAVAELSAAGIRALTCQPPSLEELFLGHYAAEGAR